MWKKLKNSLFFKVCDNTCPTVPPGLRCCGHRGSRGCLRSARGLSRRLSHLGAFYGPGCALFCSTNIGIRLVVLLQERSCSLKVFLVILNNSFLVFLPISFGLPLLLAAFGAVKEETEKNNLQYKRKIHCFIIGIIHC